MLLKGGMKMRMYEIYTKQDVGIGNIFNTNAITDNLYLNPNDTSEVTYTKEQIVQTLMNRHGDKRIIDMPMWVSVRLTSSKYVLSEWEKYNWWLQEMWDIFIKNMNSQFSRMYLAIIEDYNPIENYNRIESWTDTDSGENTLTYNGSVSVEKGGTVSNTRTSTDEVSFTGKEKVSDTDIASKTNTGTQGTAFTGKETTSDSGTETKQTTSSDSVEYSGQESEKNIVSDVSTKNGTHTDTHSEKAFNNTDTFTETTKDVGEDSNIQESLNRDSTTTKTYTDRFDTTNHTGTDSNTLSHSSEKTFENREDVTTFNLSENADSTKESEKTFVDRKDSRSVSDNGTETIDTTDLTTYNGRNDVTRFGKSTSHDAHIHGNIGVTTSMTMIQEELQGRKYELLAEIVDMFAMRVCY